MIRLNHKNRGPDAPDIPDLGSRRRTQIKYEMTQRSGKLDTADMSVELGEDPKASITTIVPRRVPKSNYNLASDEIPNPDDLEVSIRKQRNPQVLDVSGGGEYQIKGRNVKTRSKRKTLNISSQVLDDVNTHQVIKGPTSRLTKDVSKSAHIEIGDTRDVNTGAIQVPAIRSKMSQHNQINVQTHDKQDIFPPTMTHRDRKVPEIVPVATSSGFQYDFNPMLPAHREKVKKVLNRITILTSQDPEVAMIALSNLNFKSKKSGTDQLKSNLQQDSDQSAITGHMQTKTKMLTKGVQRTDEDGDDAEIRIAHKSRVMKKSIIPTHVQEHENDDVYDTRHHKSRVEKKSGSSPHIQEHENDDVYDTRHHKSRVEKKSTGQVQVAEHENDDVYDTRHNSRVAKKSIGHAQVGEHENDEVYDTRHDQKVRKQHKNRIHDNPDSEDRMEIESSNTRGNPKSRVDVNAPSLDSDVRQEIDTIKVASKRKKNGARMSVAVEASDSEVTFTSKPPDYGEVKSVKQPETLEVQLYPTDKETEGEIRAPKAKKRGAKARLPTLEPTLDDNEVEIEKDKNLLIFT